MSTSSPRPADSHHLLDDSTLHQHDSLPDEQQRHNFHDKPGGRGGAEETMVQNSSSGSSYTNKMNSSGGGVSEISTSQRMISATWGSILTSLLVTPLDVVRVRLQSQTAPTPAPINLARFPAYATQFANLPPDLGVRACCKEVFWMGDNAPFCLAGNGGGAATATATATSATTAAADCAVEETQKRTFNSTMDGLRKIARNEGYLTLWRGLSPTLAMAIPANVIYFAGYDWMRFSEASPIKKIAGDTYSPLIAGAGARVLAAVVVSPVEMFRTRMQAASGSATGVFKETLVGLHRMTQSQGYTSLWRGLTLTMWRDVPFSAIYWWGYEGIRNSLSDARLRSKTNNLTSDSSISSSSAQPQDTNSHTSTFIDSFTAGAISGAVSALVTTPFDVGKTKQQVYRHAGDDSSQLSASQKATKLAGTTAPEELSMPRFLYHIYREQGTSGLFKGWGPRCLKVAPACAIMISTYELGKKWAVTSKEKKREEREAI